MYIKLQIPIALLSTTLMASSVAATSSPTSSPTPGLLQFQTMNAAQMVAQLVSSDESLEVRNAAGSSHLDKCAALFTEGHKMGNLVEKIKIGDNWVAKKQLDATNGVPLRDSNGDYIYFPTETPIVPETGIILSSGSPNDFNWNDKDDTTTEHPGIGGDQNLKDTVDASNGMNNGLFDACVLQFEFRCTNNAFVPQISFNYIWGSEEYYEYVDSVFNDVFGFYLNGVNIATLPQTQTASDVVSINNVNYNTNGMYFNGNDPGTGWEVEAPDAPDTEVPYPQIEADGFTDTLTAYGTPYGDAGEWNLIKLAVADVGDNILDSWVVLEGASFTCMDITAAPSVSKVPTESPTDKPSVSTKPTLAPSVVPTLSTAPSLPPSLRPTTSSKPTLTASVTPTLSTKPSYSPSLAPSTSSAPSITASHSPSTSKQPSGSPTDTPSTSSQPTGVPSMDPTSSTKPSLSPSMAPSISSKPTIHVSDAPSTSLKPTGGPTDVPSTSTQPTGGPSANPTITSKPSYAGSYPPSKSSAPSTSAPTTGAPTESPTETPSISSGPTLTASHAPSTSTAPSSAPTAKGSIGPVLVFNDLNENGLYDEDTEEPLPGVTVTLEMLHDATYQAVQTTVTDDNGMYNFTGMEPGNYLISVNNEVGGNDSYVFSPQVDGGNVVNPQGYSDPFPIGYNTNIDGLLVGMYLPLADIGPNVAFDDLDEDGVYDEDTEGPLVGVQIELNCDGEGVAWTTTNASGYYEFTNVQPGDCYIEVTPEVNGNDNYVFSPVYEEDPENPDTTGNQIHPNGTSPTVTIGYNDTVDDWNVGLFLPLSQIGPNTAFNDLNMNGVWDVEDEPVLADVPIALICDGSEVATTTTNATGIYGFNDVQPGDCNIQVTSLGEDYTFSPVTTGGNQIDPDAGASPTVTIGYNDTVDTWDIGMFMPPATIGPNVVFEDEDGDGQRDPMEPPLENITIYLYCLDENDQYVVTDTVVTDAQGQYEFENVQPGLCYIAVNSPTDPETNEEYVPSPVCNETGCNQVYPNGTTVPEDIDWNDNVDDWNVGLYVPVTLGNKVFDDLNGNSVQDEGEPGIEDVPVTLLDGDGNPVMDDDGNPVATTTDDSGTYWFADLPPGDYSVQFELPVSYVFAPVGPSSDSLMLDPNEPIPDIAADIVDGTSITAPQTLVSGENNTSFDAGIFIPVVVGGSVWEDINGNGLLDAGEEPLEDAGVTIFDENNQFVNYATTGPDGTYALNLDPGTYYAIISPPSDGNDYKLSPITPNGSDFDPDTMKTAPVTLVSGDSGIGSFDAGFYVPITVTSYVWDDADGDGIQDPEESGYNGPMVVNLYNDINPDDPFISVVTDVTDGSFQITDIPPGDYVFEFVPEDEDVVFSPPNQGGDDSKDSDVDPETGKTVPITLESGNEITDVAAGITNMPSIGPNIVCNDLNGDGLCGASEPGLEAVAVTLYDDEGEEVDVTFTDANGEYSFSNLEPGSYYISVNKDPNYVFSPVVPEGNVIYLEDEGNRSPTVTLDLGDNDDTLIVAMYDPVTIGNKVWDDLNGDGVQQLTEPGMNEVTATLLDVNGVALQSTFTDIDGHYYFYDIPPGGYAVKFSLPNGYIFTVQAKDSVVITDPSHPDVCLEYGCVTSDADRETGITDTKFVTSGADNYSFDAGMFIPVTISGTTWHDLNADGFRQPEEVGLEGTTISLYDGDGDLIGIRVTDPSIRVTDEYGTWIFEDMPPGIYQAKVTPPDGEWTLSPKPANRTAIGTDFDPETMMSSPIYLQGGETGEGLFDAGLYLPATIGDRVWYDTLPNGIQDGDEVAFDQPVQIKLYDELGYLQAETESDESGFYSFYPVRPGTYSLEFILDDEDYQWTIPNAGNDTDVDSNVSPTSNRASVTVTSGEEKLDIDAGVMDFGPYYPDWTNDVQVCTNDGFDPAWLEIQEVNYLYKNKEDCCKNHFWWRMTQCMANEEFHFYKNGDICDTKIYFEDWEDNSPADWIDSKHFDTVEECCANAFFYDYENCLSRSPIMFKFDFCVDIQGLVDPADCQSADIFANVLEDAVNEGCHHHGEDGTNHTRRLDHIPDVTSTDANITKIGFVTLTKESGSTVCGGSLGSQGFINELTGTIPDIEAAKETISSVCGVISVEEEECKEPACLQEHYEAISHELKTFVDNGDLTLAIERRSKTRLPPVPELYAVSALPFSLVTQNLKLPGTVTGDVVLLYHFGSNLKTCEAYPDLYYTRKPNLITYESLRECCAAHFSWDESGCRSAFNSGRRLAASIKEDAVTEEEEGSLFYATWRDKEWCSSKTRMESWEDEADFFPSRAACCESLGLKAEHNAECLRLATA